MALTVILARVDTPRLTAPSVVVFYPGKLTDSILTDSLHRTLASLRPTLRTATMDVDIVPLAHAITEGDPVLGNPQVERLLLNANTLALIVIYPIANGFGVIGLSPVDELLRRDEISMATGQGSYHGLDRTATGMSVEFRYRETSVMHRIAFTLDAAREPGIQLSTDISVADPSDFDILGLTAELPQAHISANWDLDLKPDIYTVALGSWANPTWSVGTFVAPGFLRRSGHRPENPFPSRETSAKELQSVLNYAIRSYAANSFLNSDDAKNYCDIVLSLPDQELAKSTRD
jgi:hypothetical protein